MKTGCFLNNDTIKKSNDFSLPGPNLKRDDAGELREKIKGLSYKKMEGYGI
jgi:hypothetical protein